MYLVRVGFYIWVGSDGLLTTSLAHAHGFADTAEAEVAAAWVRDNYVAAVAGLPETPRTLRAHYLEKRPPVDVVPRETQRQLVYDTDGSNPPPVAGTSKPTPAPRGQPYTDAEPKPPGITRQVYQWCLDHPQATKADAIAAWPTANPSTVGVQYSAAKRAAN